MLKKTHKLILSSPKIVIPESNVIGFVNELIISNLVNIDYFGNETAKAIDDLDKKMISKITSSTYITFHFDFESANTIISSQMNEEEIFILIQKLLKKQTRVLIIDEKDIEIYID